MIRKKIYISILYNMTDYINSAVNPDYLMKIIVIHRLAVKAGEYSSFTKPINVGGAFIYNRLFDASIVYESVVTSPSAISW